MDLNDRMRMLIQLSLEKGIGLMQAQMAISPFQAGLQKQYPHLKTVQKKLTNSVSMAVTFTLVYPFRKKKCSAISYHQNRQQVRLMYGLLTI